MLTFPHISPVAFEIGPLVIRWYALAYVVGILLAQYYVNWLDTKRPPRLLSKKIVDDLVLYAVLGIILGGRLGYVLFYNAAYYVHHLVEILHVWQGGMSFHGGLVGVTLAFFILARRHNINWLALMDRVAAAAPIGLFLGRLANFVNGELFGRVTDVPWGMVFPRGGPEPRHPSQLYEAGMEGLVLFILLFLLATRTRLLERPGAIAGCFLLGYGVFRFLIEFCREPDVQVGTFYDGATMGQLLCLPMIALGITLLLRAKRRAA